MAHHLVGWLGEPDFVVHIWQLLAKNSSIPPQDFTPLISVFPSAVATFYAPSDLCGTGMQSERIRAVQSWRGGSARYDCVFVTRDLSATPPADIKDLYVSRVTLLFSFSYCHTTHQCALVHLLPFKDDRPDEDTGMWIVERSRSGVSQVIPLNAIYRAAHLIPVFHGVATLSRTLSAANSLDHFRYYYVNKFIDHHAFEILHQSTPSLL
jgi:hypothetical protein